MDQVNVDDLQLLMQLDEEGLLGKLGRAHLAQRRALEAEVRASREQLLNPGKRARVPTGFLDSEPTKGDQVAIAVLHDADGLGSRLANVVTVIGESRVGSAVKSWAWQGPGLEFVSRDVWTTIRRSERLRAHLLVLDPGRKQAGAFDDLFGLLAATTTPARLRHVHEVWRAIVRSTSSLTLLERWASHADVKRDAMRRRDLADQIARARRAQAEAAAE